MAIATSITMIASLVSCSSAPTEKAPPPEFHFTSIALVSPQEFVDASRPKTRGQMAQEGATAGLLGGTLGGAAAGAIACGPFLYGVCVAALAGAGMIAGSATGALYGFSGFPRKVAVQLEQRVESLSSEYDLQSLLVNNIRERVPADMLVEPAIADVQAVLVIENVELVKGGDNCHVVSTVKATYEGAKSRRVPEHGTSLFKGTSGKFDLELLLDKESDSLKQAIEQSLVEVADQVVAALNHRWEPKSG